MNFYSSLIKKELLSLVAISFSIASLAVVMWFRPDFTLSISTKACDAWYYFATTYLFDFSHILQPGHYYYYNDRLPANLPRAVINYLFEFPIGRYLYVFILHILSLLALRKIFGLLVGTISCSVILFLYAFSPLVFGSYHTDYIAIDALHYSLWSFYFLIQVGKIDELRRSLCYSFWGGVFFVLALHSHFKIGIYSLFILILVFFEPHRTKLQSQWLAKGGGFGVGLLLPTVFLALFNWLVLGGKLYFFEEQISAIFLNEDGYTRKFFELVSASPCLLLYVWIPVLYFNLPKKIQKQPIAWGCLFQFIFIGIWALSGGNYFVESNYIWAILPVLVLFSLYIENLSLGKTQFGVLVALLLLSLFGFFVQDISLQFFLYEKLDIYYPFVLLGVLLAAFCLLHLVTRKNNYKQVKLLGVGVFFITWFLVRPDFQFGEELFKKGVYSFASVAHLKKSIDLAREISDKNSDSTVPVIFAENLNDPVVRLVQNQFVQCGPHHRPNLDKIIPLVATSLRKESYVFYLTQKDRPVEMILRKLLFAGVGVELVSFRKARYRGDHNLYQFKLLVDYNSVESHEGGEEWESIN